MSAASLEPQSGRPRPSWGVRQVAGLFRGHLRLVTVFALSSFGRSAAQVMVLLLIQRFLSGQAGGSAAHGPLFTWFAGLFGPSGTLWAVAILLLLVQVAGSLCSYANFVAQQHVNQVVELGTIEIMIRQLLRLSVPFFSRQSHGDIVEMMLNDVGQLRVLVRSVFNIFFEGLLALGLLATVVKLSPRLSLLALVVVPLGSLPIYLIASRTLKKAADVRMTGYIVSDLILQVLRGIRIIKVFQVEEAQEKKTVEQAEVYHRTVIARIRVERLAGVVMESLGGVLLVVVIVAGGQAVASGEIGWGGLLAFVIAVRGLLGPINNMSNHYVDVQVTKPSIRRIASFLAQEPEIVDPPHGVRLEGPPRTIAFDRVSFSYGHETVLRDVSFEVRAGETIGVVSPSGGGKSTLLGLLVRFYDPVSGSVRFDGRDLREIRLADLQAQMTLVTQEPFIFAATVRENILYGRLSATDAEVEAAARAAYIHDEIMALPQGYSTLLGVGGRDLSGGQKQRLSIARALLKNAPILLLDEATSALDSVSESEVQRAVERLMEGRTSLVVAHRLSTLRNADRLLVLDRGELVAVGRHEELLRDCPLYRTLWQTQVHAASAL